MVEVRLWYQVPRDATLCAHFSVESGVIFTGVWRSILGLNGFIYGIILLHYDEKLIKKFLYAILARDTGVQTEYINVIVWGYGYVIGGMIQMLIALTLLYCCLAEKLTARLVKYYQIVSAILSAILVVALMYVIHLHEMRRLAVFGDRVPYPDFMLFALPFLGEAFHWYFLLVVRCMWVDLTEASYPVYEYRFNPEEEEDTAKITATGTVDTTEDLPEETAEAGTAEDIDADTAEDVIAHAAEDRP